MAEDELIQNTFPSDTVAYFKCRFNRSGHSLVNYAFRHCIGPICSAYGLLGFSALCANLTFLLKVAKSGKLHQSYLYKYLFILCCCHVVCWTSIVPFGVAVQVTYWNYGRVPCFGLPVLQDFMTHFHYLILLTLAVERYREIVKRQEVSYHFAVAFLTILAVSLLLSLPDVLFIKFYKSVIHGIPLEICVVDTKPMEEYARAMFIFVYAVPVLAISFLSIQVSAELRVRSEDIDYQLGLDRSGDSSHRRRYRVWASMCSDESSRQQPRSTEPSNSMTINEAQVSFNIPDPHVVLEEINKKCLTQKYLNIIAASTVIAWLPLNIASVVQFGLQNDKCSQLDKHAHLYAIVVWMAYFPSLLTPILALGLLWDQQIDFAKYFSIHYYQSRFGGFKGMPVSKSNTMATTVSGDEDIEDA